MKKLATEAEYWIPRNDRSWTTVTNTRNRFDGLFGGNLSDNRPSAVWRKDEARKRATVDGPHGQDGTGSFSEGQTSKLSEGGGKIRQLTSVLTGLR